MKIIILGLLVFCVSLKASIKDGYVAEVAGTKISVDDFVQAYRQNRLVVSNKRVTKESVLNQLINRAIGIANAKKEKLDHNPDVKRRMEDVLFHAYISKVLEPKLSKLKDSDISEAELKDYYRRYPEYRTAHILIRTKAVASDEEMKPQLEVALELTRQLRKDPNQFAILASKYSESTLAANGGDAGFQPAAAHAPQYFEAIKGRPVGFITNPIKTQFGFHIIKVLGVKKFEEINKDMYKKLVYDEKRDALMEEYYDSQRKIQGPKIDQNLLESLTF